MLLPIRAVSRVLRGKRLAALRRAREAARWQCPPDLSEQTLHNRLNKRGRTQWHVHMRERDAHGRGVLTSRARDLWGGPIADRRLVTASEQVVTFRDADNREPDAQGRGQRKRLTLSVEEVLARLLPYVPPPHLRVVRSWGGVCHRGASHPGNVSGAAGHGGGARRGADRVSHSK